MYHRWGGKHALEVLTHWKARLRERNRADTLVLLLILGTTMFGRA